MHPWEWALISAMTAGAVLTVLVTGLAWVDAKRRHDTARRKLRDALRQADETVERRGPGTPIPWRDDTKEP